MTRINFKVIGLTRPRFEPAGSGFQPMGNRRSTSSTIPSGPSLFEDGSQLVAGRMHSWWLYSECCPTGRSRHRHHVPPWTPSQPAKHIEPIWGPYGLQYRTHMGCPYGTHIVFANWFHMNPIWTTHMGPIWVPYGPYMGPKWDLYGTYMGPIYFLITFMYIRRP